MKKNLYYQHVFQRRNMLKEILLNFFIAICSWPRLLLEVFTRRNMGERYFSFSSAIIVTVILAIAPYGFENTHSYFGGGKTFFEVLGHYWSWYLYLVAFVFMSLKRRQEIKREPSVFDFARFSLSTGLIDPRIRNIKFGDKSFSIRTVETAIEPAFFLVVGLLLALLGQGIGYLIVSCSIIYSLSYCAAYYIGDNFIMDKIDEMICNEELTNTFVDEMDTSETRGFNAYGRKPADPEMRRKVADSIIVDDDFEEVR